VQPWYLWNGGGGNLWGGGDRDRQRDFLRIWRNIEKLSREMLMDVKSWFTQVDLGFVRIWKYVFVLEFSRRRNSINSIKPSRESKDSAHWLPLARLQLRLRPRWGYVNRRTWFGYPDCGFPWFFSVVTQMPGYSMQSRGTARIPLPQTRWLHLSAWQTSHTSSLRQSQSGLGTQTANQPKFISPILSPGQPRP